MIDISDVQGDDRALPLVMVAAITWLRELLTADVPTSSSTVGLGIEFEDADNFVVRVHPEDAERYSLPEEIFLEFNERTGRSQAVFQREEAGPSHVCLAHNIYLVDLVEQQQTVLFANRDSCVTLLRGSPGFDNAEWEPIPASS